MEAKATVNETRDIKDPEQLKFWREMLNIPEVKEKNINRFINAIFCSTLKFDEDELVVKADKRDAILKTIFSEVDTERLIGELWKGVGKLDSEDAKIVCAETCKCCYQNWVDKEVVMERLGYDIDQPNIKGCLMAHENIENSAAGGIHANVTDNGDGTCTAITQSGQCVCYFTDKMYGVIEPHPNHCNCTISCLEGFYGNLLGKPVEFECVESYAKGDNRCKFIGKLPEMD